MLYEMRLQSIVHRCFLSVSHQANANRIPWRLVTIRPGSFSVWPSTLYKKMSITGEMEDTPPNSGKLTALEEKPDRGMLFIIGAPRLPKIQPRKTHTANTLMVNTADHPSYYDLQVDYNTEGPQILKK